MWRTTPAGEPGGRAHVMTTIMTTMPRVVVTRLLAVSGRFQPATSKDGRCP